MRLYAGLSTHFVRDTAHNQIAEKLKSAFFDYYRYNPSPAEVGSWKNSLRATAQVFEEAGLRDHGVILEYQLPQSSKRLDCMVCGRDGQASDNAVIIELKQWDGASEAVGDKMVTTRVGGSEREVLHPSAQVGQYRMYVEDTHTAFYEGSSPIRLSACSYLHNYHPEPGDVLLSDPFQSLLERNPLFSADDVGDLKDFLVTRLEAGDGLSVMRRVEESRYRPSKKLMDHVGGVIRGSKEYVLLDEQLIVFEKVLLSAREGFHDRKKVVIIVKGGPGTGKSVIAINLMAELSLGSYNAQYATGSRAFTQTLRKIIGPRGAVQFKYFNSYLGGERDVVDVLICDESHRIREESHGRFTPAAERTGRPQIEELIHAAKVGVYFIDDRQIVRPKEIGSVSHIREHAEAAGCRVFEYQLEAQFRCAGSDGFVNWIDNTLGIARTANVLWADTEGFDFQIMNSPTAVEAAIRAKANEGFSARMTAGYCWAWSDARSNGTLVDDVVIGDYRRPWNAKSGARLAAGIPIESLWATEAGGIDQVGCVYTAQGFEFDYAGVIVGPDLTYDFNIQDWVGHPEHSFDRPVKTAKKGFVAMVKNTYRVLLSRGIKGCYVYFTDERNRAIRAQPNRAIRSFGKVTTWQFLREQETSSCERRHSPKIRTRPLSRSADFRLSG